MNLPKCQRRFKNIFFNFDNQNQRIYFNKINLNKKLYIDFRTYVVYSLNYKTTVVLSENYKTGRRYYG